MEQGYSTREAARIVGIDLRTGKKWRNGQNSPGKGRRATPPIYQDHGQTSGHPAGPGEPPSRPSRYSQEHDRTHIADRLREKASIRQIAAELGRSPSTVSREIHRNRRTMPNGGWYYRPHTAQARADARRPRPKPGKIGQNTELRDFVQNHLTMRWSPEQICQALRARFPDRPEMHVTHETIYQALYVQGRGELRRELIRALGTGRARRRPNRHAHKRISHPVKDMVMISDRPAEAEDRAFTVATDIPVYFCNPASPWQRGSNENTNGLLRQYFPKATDLAVHTPEDLAAVAAELNSRPRKTLGWETPAARLRELTAPLS
ncbi:IS30 family transposase [Streptomyces sp. V4I23]|uniref:IS30 family transposase n=1 Tax=Streptomyces sp. V4I23 TaxID=3042282 RepID=UPI00278362F6|nr:IS30 family transposase [Streptomyces sp. V4I23]MDQ1013173.1 IS30 family transposase [Streptomyces sp. V4I23]